jgi:V/A-type H+/Na+-transporting ATPase subunit B
MLGGLGELINYSRATAIVGDILKIRASDVGLGEMAVVQLPDGESSMAQVIQLERDEVSLQVFPEGRGFPRKRWYDFSVTQPR